MGELLDLELLVLQLAILAGEGFDQAGGEFAQLLRVHPSQLIVHLHAFDIATSHRINNNIFTPRESLLVRRCDTMAIRSPAPATAQW